MKSWGAGGSRPTGSGEQQWHGLVCNTWVYSVARYGLRLPARRRKRKK